MKKFLKIIIILISFFTVFNVNALSLKEEITIKATSNLVNFLEDDLNNYLSNYPISVIYVSLDSYYSYKYNPNEVYYGASLIKLLDASYILDNDIDLNTILTKQASDGQGEKNGLKDIKNGSSITINDTLKSLLTVSDNAAHSMLYRYITKSTLKNYGNSIGMQNILTYSDKFGNMSASDAIKLLNHIYPLLETKENGAIIKSYLENNYYNSFNSKYETAHKYGMTDEYYHDIAIVYDKHPYALVIMSKLRYKDYETVFKTVQNKLVFLNKIVSNY